MQFQFIFFQFLSLLFFSILYIPQYKYPIEINNCKLIFYHFQWNLEILSQNLTLIPFDENKEKQCDLCKFKPNNILPNSSPRDVILTFGYDKFFNLILFLRTLRTTGCKASCVFFLEKKYLYTIKGFQQKFIEKCNAQIIPFEFNFNFSYTKKNYLFNIYELFLRYNKERINRVMICDLADFIFQGDPFHELLPKNEIHIADEGLQYKSNNIYAQINILWIKAHDQSFELKPEQYDYYYWCAGYMEGPISLMIEFINQYNQVIIDEYLATDQGGFNYLNLTGRLEKAMIPISLHNNNELIRHSSVHTMFDNTIPDLFPNVTTMYNKSLTAIAIHHYYNSNDEFRISVLKACPRPNKMCINYLSRCDDLCISKLEEKIVQETIKQK